MTESLAALESELSRLPQPEPPAGLTEAVMARVARVDLDRRGLPREDARRAPRGVAAAGGEQPFAGRGRLAAALVASGLVAYVLGLEQGVWTFDPAASPTGEALTALAVGPESVSAALGLAIVMLLYLAGLLATIERGNPQP